MITIDMMGAGQTPIGRCLADQWGGDWAEGDDCLAPRKVSAKSVRRYLWSLARWPWSIALESHSNPCAARPASRGDLFRPQTMRSRWVEVLILRQQFMKTGVLDS